MFTDNKVVIDCEKRLSLGNYSYINNITGCINDYNEDNNVVYGNVLLNVDYNYENELCKKEELIPFEINLLNGKKIDEIIIINFRYYEIVGEGLQCSFQIYLTLKDCGENEEPSIDESLSIENKQSEEKEIENKYDVLLDEIFNGKEENDSEQLEKEETNDNEEDEENDNNDDELIEEETNPDQEIDIYYQNLNKGLNIECNCKESVRANDSVSLRNIKETMSTFAVYYPKTEQEIDKVCVSENVSLQTIYNNQLNNEFSKKKRIIIEK